MLLKKNDYQHVFQISLLIQRSSHIEYSKPLKHYFWEVLSQLFSAVSAYKDPVENQHMKKILDKLVTGFFVVTLGILWYCSTKYYVKPNHYSIVIYDVFGKPVNTNEIRTEFQTKQVAQSYISEYQNRFPHYDFGLGCELPQIKVNLFQKIFRKIKDSAFACE